VIVFVVLFDGVIIFICYPLMLILIICCLCCYCCYNACDGVILGVPKNNLGGVGRGVLRFWGPRYRQSRSNFGGFWVF